MPAIDWSRVAAVSEQEIERHGNRVVIKVDVARSMRAIRSAGTEGRSRASRDATNSDDTVENAGETDLG